MSNRLKISKESSKKLEYLSKRLGLRRNVVCRLAVGRSLAVKESVESFKPKDSAGFEFNRYTLTGEHDYVFKALVVQREGRRLSDNEYFSKYFRRHIERGIELLYSEYLKINSPIDFLVGLFSYAMKQ